MDEICVAKFDVYECRKSDRASALSGAQLIRCAAQTPEFPDTIPTIWVVCLSAILHAIMGNIVSQNYWTCTHFNFARARLM